MIFNFNSGEQAYFIVCGGNIIQCLVFLDETFLFSLITQSNFTAALVFVI